MRTNVVGSKLMSRFCVASLLPILPRPVSSTLKYRWTGRNQRSEISVSFAFFVNIVRSIGLFDFLSPALLYTEIPRSVDFFQRRYTFHAFRELFDSTVLEIARLFSDKKKGGKKKKKKKKKERERIAGVRYVRGKLNDEAARSSRNVLSGLDQQEIRVSTN